MDSLPVSELELLVRSKSGIYLINTAAKTLATAKRLSSDGAITNTTLFSRDGRFLLIQEKQKAYTIDLQTDKVVGQLEGVNFQNVSLSEDYVQLLDKKANDNFNLSLLSFPSLEVVCSRTLKRYKKELWPYTQITSDGKYQCYIENGEVKVAEIRNPNVVLTLPAKSCEYLTIQPQNSTNFLIICYKLQEQLSTKNNYGELLIYDFSRPQKVIYENQVPEASEIVVEWSPDGKSFLFIKASSSDSSGQSYFGQTQVFLFDWKKLDFIQIPTYEGPIHSVKWSVDSQNFIVVSGFMPSAAVLFTKEGKPQFEFGKDHRNQVYWSPLQRFVLICGFGNLDGSISVWDTILKKQVGSCKSKSASNCHWLPCGRRFITARVTPRLNVDNAYTIYDYQGCELSTIAFDDLSLFEVIPRPVKTGTFQDRPPSPSRKPVVVQQKEEKKLFIPPGGSGLLAQQLRAQKQSEGARVLSQNETFGNSSQPSWGLQRSTQAPHEQYPPGYVPPEKKEKKKRIRNKKQNQEDDN